MKRVRVKVCGITRRKDLNAAVDEGADAVGFVVDVPSSPRNMSLERARDLIEATPPFVQTVIVSVFTTIDRLAALCAYLTPNAVQVAGTHACNDTVCKPLDGIRVIRTIEVNDKTLPNALPYGLARCDAVLADSGVLGAYGGTGICHNWGISRAIRKSVAPTPFILAGGLTPENLRTAIKMVRPYAVDVSSGVEARPGVKDRAKIRAFIHAVKEASDAL